MYFFFSFWIHAWVYLRFLGISVLSQKTHGVLWKEWLYLSYKVYDCTSATNFQCSRFNLLFVFYMNEQEHYLQTHPSPFLPLVPSPFLWLHHFRNLSWMEAHRMSLGLVSLNTNHYPWGHYSFSYIINSILCTAE